MDNVELELAKKFLQETDCNIFLTGKAGTGKTTFLHSIKEEVGKRLAITAPTGVAAINAGGVTIHSFFQRPFGPWLPGTVEAHNLRKEKVNTLRNLDLLVIDEISMVRADLLDSIDFVLRRYRYSDLPFGGVQLLMIGDLYQLPPVVKDSDWQVLSPHYKTPYFFSSKALQQAELVPIELQHVYRQQDQNFVDLLNMVRENKVEKQSLARLNSRFGAEIEDQQGTITLCTHNVKADQINSQRLSELKGRERVYSAEVKGEFPETSWPTVASLTLKTGAQVMFVRNDQGEEKRFYNGKIGTVSWTSRDEVGVRCPEDDEEIVVQAINWENVEYSLDEESMELGQDVVGTFSQIPLKLAWAITIHKSQGLTFDRVIIDAGASFAHGQTYVALSRCRSFSGMTLATEITSKSIKTDSNVQQFSRWALQHKPSVEQLQLAQVQYQQRLLFRCFDFGRLRAKVGNFLGLLNGNSSRVQIGGVQIDGLLKEIDESIVAVGENFCRQLASYFKEELLPSENSDIQERLVKAAHWFSRKFDELLMPLIDQLVFETDNKQLRTRLNKQFKEALFEIRVKYAAVSSCAEGFSAQKYLRAVSTAAVEAEKNSGSRARQEANLPLYREEDIAHPQFFETLKAWRKEKASEEDLPAYRVLAQKPLVQLAIHLPISEKEMKKIHGIGPKLFERYGAELLSLIKKYRLENKITEITLPEISVEELKQRGGTSAKKSDTPTRLVSLELFRSGLSIAEVAEKRGYVKSTIEGHFADCIAKGEAEFVEIVGEESAELLSAWEKLEYQPEMGWASAKEKLGAILGREVSYGTLKLLIAHSREE